MLEDLAKLRPREPESGGKGGLPALQTRPIVQGIARLLAFLALLLVGVSEGVPAEVPAFGDLDATALHGRRVDLSWTDASFEEGYRVARSCDEGDAQGYCTIASLGPDVVTFTDIEVQEATHYEYRVEAFSESASETVFSSAETLAPALLPTADPPIYFEPQGVWGLGSSIPLLGITQLRVRHNLGSNRELRILLDAKHPHSLLSRLENAGYRIDLERRYTGASTPGVTEIYFYDLTRGSSEGPLPPAIDAFDRMGEEGYVLVAEPMGENSIRIVVGARTPKGLFRGGFTVERLLLDVGLGRRRATLNPVVILDYPDHAFRGARPSWVPMSMNYEFVPEPTLDMLDTLARSGATEVDWSYSTAAQESYTWKSGGARTAAVVQVAAAERFMDVNYFVGAAVVIDSLKGPPEVREPEVSFDQIPFGDGLGVVAEPFFWIETSPGQWKALSTRQGTLHGRSPTGQGRPWLAKPCGPGGWKYGVVDAAGGAIRMGWRLDGMASQCSLIQSLEVDNAFASGRYHLGARVKASEDVTNLSGVVQLVIERASGTTRFPLAVPSKPSSDGWTEIGVAFEVLDGEEPARAARIVIRASLTAGSLWIDGVALHEWSRPILAYQSFSKSGDWSLSSGGFTFDDSIGRSDSTSLKVKTPVSRASGGSAHIAEHYAPVRLEEGRYLLGAWVKAERPKPEPLDREIDLDGDDLEDLVESNTGIFQGAKDTGSDPTKTDTDGDGFPDGIEVASGSNPNLKSSKPNAYFPMRMDVNLYLFDRVRAGPADVPSWIDRQFLNFPSTFKLTRDGWMYHAHIFDVSGELASRVRSGRLQIRLWPRDDPGTVWIDGIHLQRLDGDLRNLMGAVQAPVLKSPSGVSYVEGRDYQVCQVGKNQTQCTPPSNYTTLLDGGLGATYNPDQSPFEIRWLNESPPEEKKVLISYDIGAQYSTVASTGLTWDDQPVVRKALNLCDFEAVARGVGLEAIFGRYLDGHKIHNFPDPGRTYTFKANSITWGLSEVRGVGRSIACLDENLERKLSNASIFSAAVNEIVRIAKEKRPEVRLWFWDDMFNPFNNGGDPDYQRRYGGVSGRSACSFAPAAIKSLCGDEIEDVPIPILENAKLWGDGIVMKPWSYAPHGLRRMVATSSWYQGLGVNSQVLSGADPVNVEDWAGIANTFDRVQGVMGTIYHANRYGGRSGLLPALQKFWNHDWKLLYLHDNETPESSHYQPAWSFTPSVELIDATQDIGGNCAAFNFKFAGNNEGGICLKPAPASPKIRLGEIPTRGGASYRVDVLARRSKNSRSSPAKRPPTFRILWSNGDSSGPLVSELIYDTMTDPRPDYFDRYRVEADAPSGATSMKIEISFGTGGESAAADDIVIFESTEQCFDACQAPPDLPDAEVTRLPAS